MTLDNDTKIDDVAAGVDSFDAAEQPKKQRKPREPKPKPNQTGKKEKLSSRQLTGIIYLANSAAANALNTPQLEIEETEATAIADALVDLLQHYDFEASAKTLAWANLFGVLATVYGVRVWSILQHKRHVPRGMIVDEAAGD